jgi:hypothetical protein
VSRHYEGRRDAQRTVYESRTRQRSRRRRRAVLVGVLVAACAAVLVVAVITTQYGAGAGAGTRAAAASPSPTAGVPTQVSTVALGDVKVHRGEEARLRYRVDDPEGRTWAAKLQVLAASGDVVKTQGLGAAVTANKAHAVGFRAAFPVGTYTYAVHVQGAQGAVETTATPARLTVLKPLPPAFPGAKAVAAALKWAGGRSGEVGVAVLDSRGRLSGLREHARFTGASLVKAMLLVAYLRSHPKADPSLDAVATKMIEQSDNASAFTIQGVVGMSGVKKVAALAKMKDFRAGSSWLDSQVSAADQARFFYDYLEYVPASRRSFARRLLSGITYMQRWGIPAAAGPEGWRTFFKGGWLYLDNVLMVQAAWVEKDGVKWAVAVMTDENPTKSYGWDTQKGFTGLLLGRQPTPAYLARVLE